MLTELQRSKPAGRTTRAELRAATGTQCYGCVGGGLCKLLRVLMREDAHLWQAVRQREPQLVEACDVALPVVVHLDTSPELCTKADIAGQAGTSGHASPITCHLPITCYSSRQLRTAAVVP